MSVKQSHTRWQLVRLGDHVTKVGSGITPLGGYSVYQSSGVPLIRSQNVHMNRFEVEGLAFISEAQDDLMQTSRVLPGDVLLNITGASIGRVCVVPDEFCPANVNQHVSIIRTDGTIEPKFLSYYISSPSFQKFIFGSQAGATRQALTKTLIEEFLVPFPSLSEQRRVTATIETHMQQVERAHAGLQSQLVAAERLLAACLREVFGSDEAKAWKRIPISKLGEDERDVVQTGPFGAQLPSSEFADYGIPVLNVGNVRHGFLDFSKLDYISDAKAETLSRYKLKEGDLLFTRSGSVGRSAVCPPEAQGWLISYHLLRVAFNRNVINPQFVTYAMQGCSDVLAQIRLASSRGSTRDGVNTSILSSLQIPVPSLDVQEWLVGEIDRKLVYINRTLLALQQQLTLMNQFPSAILRQAFAGEL